MADSQFYRDASNKLTFEMFSVSADSYRAISRDLESALHLTTEKTLITNGLDIVFQDYRCGDQVVGLEWDNWSGYMVVAKTEASESLVREIAEWLLQSEWVSAPTNNTTPSP